MHHRSIDLVFETLRDHLRSRPDQLVCFATYKYQAEAWLKAEWIRVLDGLKAQGRIHNLKREVKITTGKLVDIVFDLHDGRHWIELKHWYLGEQDGHVWQPMDFIFEFENEFKKFETVNAGDRAWVAALCTNNPGTEAWTNALDAFNRENAPWAVKPIDKPGNYPPEYFLGILHVRGLGA